MAKFDPFNVQWQKPWLAVSPDIAERLVSELHREISAGHVLFGRSPLAIGRRQDRDDVLFYLGDNAPCFAVVHLTFSNETRSDWPKTRLFDSFPAWFEQCMVPDAKSFAS
jgi:hypothetical protein